MKNIMICLICFFGGSLVAEELPIEWDLNRFFADNEQTKFEITYKIKNSDIEFREIDHRIISVNDVEYAIYQGDSLITSRVYQFVAGATSWQQARLASNYSLDKLEFVLAEQDYRISVTVTNRVNQKSHLWESDLLVFNQDTRCSDLEFSQNIFFDAGTFMENFRRDGALFYVAPAHMYTLPKDKIVNIYYQLNANEIDNFSQEIEIKLKGETVYAKQHEYESEKDIIPVVKSIDIADFSEGYYTVRIAVKSAGKKIHAREDYFVVKRTTKNTMRLMVDIEDEYLLLSHLTVAVDRSWENIDHAGKEEYLARYWKKNEFLHGDNDYFELIKERLAYVNKKYSSNIEGWKTDRGRVYLRYGKPDSIDDYVTDSTSTRYAIRDYQIWKYRSGEYLTYLFMDFRNSGNHRIIYVENDPQEKSHPRWLPMLGKDFERDNLQ